MWDEHFQFYQLILKVRMGGEGGEIIFSLDENVRGGTDTCAPFCECHQAVNGAIVDQLKWWWWGGAASRPRRHILSNSRHTLYHS